VVVISNGLLLDVLGLLLGGGGLEQADAEVAVEWFVVGGERVKMKENLHFRQGLLYLLLSLHQVEKSLLFFLTFKIAIQGSQNKNQIRSALIAGI
jgi:hypothetical protein